MSTTLRTRGFFLGLATIASAAALDAPSVAWAAGPPASPPSATLPALPSLPSSPSSPAQGTSSASPAAAAATGGPCWLGVMMESPADETNPGEGVHVLHAMRGSPAALAGVHDGDRIAAVAGERVTEPRDVSSRIARHQAGDTITLAIRRASVATIVTVHLTKRPADGEVARQDLLGAFAPSWDGSKAIGTGPASVASLRGKVVVLDFWATWCGPCRLTAPKLAEWQATYASRGLAVVGMSAETEGTVTDFLKDHPSAFPMLVDEKADVTRRYDVSSLPTRVIIDRRGVVRDLVVGYNPRRDAVIEQELDALLKEPAP